MGRHQQPGQQQPKQPGWSLSKREPEPDYPSDEEIAEYLAMLRDGYRGPAYPESEPRAKRYGRFGNKYADNKSYGFWISALNKAGNYKRGKRAGEKIRPNFSN